MTNANIAPLLTFLCALLGIVILILLAGRKKLSDRVRSLQEKQVQLESAAHIQKSSSVEILKKKSKTKNEDGAGHELLDARREIAKLKDELKRNRDERREREEELAQQKEDAQLKNQRLEAENKQLIESLREKDKELSHRQKNMESEARALELKSKQNDFVENDLKSELARSKQRIVELERAIKNDLERTDSYNSRLQTLQTELRRWREASTVFNGKTLDPVLFLRWRDRAIEGKKMYTLMRHLREMSDEKLVTYQNGVEVLAEYVLHSLGVSPPAVRANEVKSDRYLASAWAALRERFEVKPGPHDTSSHNQNAEQHPPLTE